MTRRIYTTRWDAIEFEITHALETSDLLQYEGVETPDELWDIDAIADEILEWVDGYDEDLNAYRLNRQGYRVREDVTEEAFWEIVAKHDLTA